MLPLSPEQEAEVRDAARASRVRALLLLRAATGCSLREAVAALEALAPIVVGQIDGTCAELFAIGPFSPAVVEHLDYEPRYYAGVAAGSPITVLVGEAHGAARVARLAEVLGIDAADMSQWSVPAERVDATALDAAEVSEADDVEALRAAGFSFHFVLHPG